MRNRSRSLAALVAVALGLSAAAPMQGSESTALHTNRLTFGGPVRLPGVTLTAGSYPFERVEPTNRDVIVVRSDDRMKVYFMGATRRADRPADLAPDRLVTLSEPARGELPAVTAWYPDGAAIGHAFVYAAR